MVLNAFKIRSAKDDTLDKREENYLELQTQNEQLGTQVMTKNLLQAQ